MLDSINDNEAEWDEHRDDIALKQYLNQGNYYSVKKHVKQSKKECTRMVT
jgi:hypothetical protein